MYVTRDTVSVACDRREERRLPKYPEIDVTNVMNGSKAQFSAVSGTVRLGRQYVDFVFPPKRDDRRNGFLRGRVPDYCLLTWVDIESATPTSSPGCWYRCCCCCCYWCWGCCRCRRGWPSPPPRENVRLAG